MADDKDDASEAQRVTVTLPADAIQFLKEEAKRTSMSMADVLRRSIATEKFFQGQRQSGADVLLQTKGASAPSRLVFKD